MSDSENIISFVCAHCGHDKFKSDREVKTLEDMLGATCANCGASLTEDDIKAQGIKIAEERMRKVFGGTRKIQIKI
jgi:transcription elongation factor Elf1